MPDTAAPPTNTQQPSEANEQIILITANGDTIPLSTKAMKLSKVLAELAEKNRKDHKGEAINIHLSMLATNVVAKVAAYLEHHKEETVESWGQRQVAERGADYAQDASYMRRPLKVSEWDRLLFEDRPLHVAPSYVFAIVVAANVLKIEMLQDLCKKMLANLVKGLDDEDARRVLGICGDYGLTREMEKNVYKQRIKGSFGGPIDLNMGGKDTGGRV